MPDVALEIVGGYIPQRNRVSVVVLLRIALVAVLILAYISSHIGDQSSEVTSSPEDYECLEEAESTFEAKSRPLDPSVERRLANLSTPHIGLIEIEHQTEVLQRDFRFTAYRFNAREQSFIRMFDDYLTEVLHAVREISVELPLYENCLQELAHRSCPLIRSAAAAFRDPSTVTSRCSQRSPSRHPFPPSLVRSLVANRERCINRSFRIDTFLDAIEVKVDFVSENANVLPGTFANVVRIIKGDLPPLWVFFYEWVVDFFRSLGIFFPSSAAIAPTAGNLRIYGENVMAAVESLRTAIVATRLDLSIVGAALTVEGEELGGTVEEYPYVHPAILAGSRICEGY